MADIYQQIWDADQQGNGVKAILDHEAGDTRVGFVKVNSQLSDDNPDPNLRVLTEVSIPPEKRRTYDLCRALFDNFALPERDPENDTDQEREELHAFVSALVETPPMEVARDYVASITGTSHSRERWHMTLMEMWFRRFEMGGDPHLTGFEHVVVGEQEKSKAQGYHFWYKYYLDDGFARQNDGGKSFPGLSDDRIIYLASRQARGQAQFPDSVTISYRWNAPDYERNKLRPLTKKVGGFFVGCSVEGLMALGTVRAHLGAKAPKVTSLNGALYELALFRSDNGRHIRTFYPKFKGADPNIVVDPGENDMSGTKPSTPPIVPTVQPSAIRIVAALVNPVGDDAGAEAVTLINTAPAAVSLAGLQLAGRNGRSTPLPAVELEAGATLRVALGEVGAQLSNKGGDIVLRDPQGQALHSVTYSKAQARGQGYTVVF